MSDTTAPPTIDELLCHADWLRSLAHAIVRDDAVAEDLVQETWLSALRSPPRSRTSIRAWLRQVLKRHAYQRYRAEVARASREAAAGNAGTAPGAAALVARTEVQSRVIRAVLDLDEPHRTTVLLRYVEDLPPRDIAARMDAPVETVRARLRRAREQLRTRLDREDGREGAWLGALVPLVVPGPGETSTATLAATGAATAGGVLAMTTTQKLIVGAVAVLLLGAGALVWLPDDQDASDDGPGIDTTAAVEHEGERTRVRVDDGRDAEAQDAAPAPEAADADADEAPQPEGPPPVLVRVTIEPPANGPTPAGVTVRVRRDGPAPWRTLPDTEVRPGETAPIDVSRLLPANESARVVVMADHPDFMPVGDRISYARPDVRARETEDVRLMLRPAIRVSGRVVDPSGEPVAGAAVGTLLPQDGKQPDLLLDRTTTGPDGTYSVRSLPGERVRLAMSADHLLPAVRDVPASDVASALDDVRLPEGMLLRGRVVADSEPLAEIEVRLSPGYGRTLALRPGGAVVLDEGGLSRITPTTRSAADGSFELRGLADQPHTLSVRVPDCAPDFEEALRRTVHPGDADVEIDVSGAQLSVLVTDTTQPVAGVDVIVRIVGRGGTARFTTDDAGRIQFLALRGSSYTVEVDDPAWVRQAQRIDVPVGAREHAARLVATPTR